MVKTGRSRVARLVLCLGGALTLGSASFGASVAEAGPLEGLPVQVGEATQAVEEVANGVAPTVKEVTEAAAPPAVAEVTETVAPPVVEATQAVVPQVKEAVETVNQTTQEVTAKVPSPAATTPSKLPSTPATDPSSGTKAVTQTVQKVTHEVEDAVGGVTGTAHSSRSPARGGAVGTSTSDTGSGPARGASVPTEAGGAGATARVTGGRDGLRDDNFAAPSPDGSIRAPLPKWMAYIWPAIALTWPELAGLLNRWERDGARLLLASHGGPSGSHGVAGAHASDDGRAASGSSSSPLAPIPSAIGGFTSHVPGEALAYLAMVGILVAAVFAAVKFELARRDRGSN